MSNISAKEHSSEAVYLLSSTTVVAIFYTLVLTLYCLSFRFSYARLRDGHGKTNRYAVCTLIFQTVLLICATSDVILKNRSAQVMYIDNSTLPGGPRGVPATLSVETLSNLIDVASAVENILVLGMLLWRVRIIWSGSRFVIPLTIISLLFYFGTAGLSVSMYAIAWDTNNTSVAITPRGEEIISLMATVFSVAGLVLMTLAIIARLMVTRRKHVKLMGNSDTANQYLGIAAMFIESYALDSLWNIGTIISFSLEHGPAMILFNNCVIQVDILTNFLLIYRVLSGRAWTRQTEDCLSTFEFTLPGAGLNTSGTVDSQQMNIPAEDPPVISSRNSV